MLVAFSSSKIHVVAIIFDYIIILLCHHLTFPKLRPRRDMRRHKMFFCGSLNVRAISPPLSRAPRFKFSTRQV